MNQEKEQFLSSLKVPFYAILTLWFIHIVQVMTFGNLGMYGIYPRTAFGLRGILFAPLIHGDFGHLLSNSVPLFVLSAIIVYFYRKVALGAILMIYFLTGLAVWAFARQVFHIGASGVVYGLVSFVFWTGIFRRSIKSIILAMIVTILYSGMIIGILPNQEGVSWESHLLGGLVGIFTAYYFKEDLEEDENKKKEPYLQDDSYAYAERPYFFDRDVFEKTKEQRLKEQQEQEEKRLWEKWMQEQQQQQNNANYWDSPIFKQFDPNNNNSNGSSSTTNSNSLNNPFFSSSNSWDDWKNKPE